MKKRKAKNCTGVSELKQRNVGFMGSDLFETTMENTASGNQEMEKEMKPMPCSEGNDVYGGSINKEQIYIEIPSKDGADVSSFIKIEATGMTLDRQSTILRSSPIILGYLALEMSKQLGIFSLSKRNNNAYPIPSALLIVLIEAFKLLIIFMVLQNSRCRYGYKIQGFSVKFFIPAFCYFITNLLYFYALTITSPPIWMILIQSRVLYTALLYKVAFSKNVTSMQMIGCVMIVLSIFLTRLSEVNSGHITMSPTLLIISQISSLLSSIASLTVEVLLKNDVRSFAEQQSWLYFCGLSLGLVALYSNPQKPNYSIIHKLQEMATAGNSLFILIACVVASGLAGLCVPCIIRNLDSIVKDYLGALNNIMLAFLTALIYPKFFSFNDIYAVSLGLLLVGIYLYEKKLGDFQAFSSIWGALNKLMCHPMGLFIKRSENVLKHTRGSS